MPLLRYTTVIRDQENLGTRKPAIGRLARRADQLRWAAAEEWISTPMLLARKRRELAARLAFVPEKTPLKPKLLGTEKYPLYIRRSYRLQINPDDATEAYLYLPRHAAKDRPVPALIGLHEHGGMFALGRTKLAEVPKLVPVFRKYQESAYGGQAPADFFAARGFAVVVIDQLGFGSRALWKDGEPPFFRGTVPLSAQRELQIRLRMRNDQFALHRALLAYGITEAEISLYDNRRTVDFLETIPEIDAARIGAFGLSMGGMHLHQLAAFEPRIKASVRVCWSGEFAPILRRSGPRPLSPHLLLPGINAECHVAELVALSYPSPALILNARGDRMYPSESQKLTRKRILHYLSLQGDRRRVQWRGFSGGHSFPPPEQARAWKFFQARLGPVDL